MSKDQTIGAVLLLVSILGIVAYGWLLYSYAILVLQVTAFIAAALILVIVGWIGWTMATTPPPAPLENEPLAPKTETGSTNEPK